MKRKLRMLLAGVLAVSSLAMSAGAASYETCADRLTDLGLFQGTDSGYELDRAPTRAEAATMLVRLLGAEEEAQALEYTAPYTDLAGWEKPYVQYLYDNNLTNGTSDTTFSPASTCSAQMYTTFLLRALGYSDAADGDFAYADAIDFGTSVGLVDMANCDTANFLRDHVAAMSLTALNTPVKGDADTKLLEKLVADGAVDAAAAADTLDFFDSYDAYVDATAQMNQETKMDLSADVNATVSMAGEQVMELSMPMDMKVDMDLTHMDQSQISMTGKMEMTVDEALVEAGAENTISQDVAYYYTDGVYYMDLGDQKVKMPMSFEDAMGQISGLDEMQSSEPICMIDSISTSGSTTTVAYSGAAMTSLVDTVLAEMGMDADATGVAIQMGDVSSSVTLSNNSIRSMKITMQITMTVEGVAMTMDMTMDCTVNATGDSVSVDIPDDLSGYTDLVESAGTAA